MTRVKCPNCGNKFDIQKSYDINFDTETICPKCSWKTSLWGFDFDEKLIEIDAKDYLSAQEKVKLM